MIVTLEVNGERRLVEVAGWESLLWVLRERLGLPGSKDACLQGECGSCSVILDGELVCSCLTMVADADGTQVVTVEGLGDEVALHPVQQAFVEHGAVQCGYCTPGLVVATAHLLEEHSDASQDEIREALSGNLCRCTGYGAVRRAVAAAQQGSGLGGKTERRWRSPDGVAGTGSGLGGKTERRWRSPDGVAGTGSGLGGST